MGAEELVGPAPDGWEYTTLGAACERGGGGIQTGPFGSQLHAADYVPVGIPSIMPQNLGDNRIVADGIARITAEDARRLSRYLVRIGDIVYSRRGDVKRRALVREREDGWLCGTGCLRVRLGERGPDPMYASYYLGHPRVRDWIVRHAHGATMPNLNTSILASCPFLVPPLREQRAIAHILGTLDDKIELNRKMNQTLEAMARALFKSWFIDFDPVRAKAEGRQPDGMDAETATLFPDEFEDSEMGPIPRGWCAGSLADVFSLAYGKSLPKGNRQPGKCPVYGSGGVSGYHSEALVSGPGVVVGRKGSVGTVYWEERDFFPIDTTFYLVAASPGWLRWGFHVLSSLEIGRLGADSAVPGVNRTVLLAQSVVVPPDTIVSAFWNNVRPLLERVFLHDQQSHTLAAIRDTLLPRLLSGEIRIEDAERFFGEVA